MNNLLYFILLVFLSFTCLGQSKNVELLDQWVDSTLPTTFDGESIYNDTWGFVQNCDEYAVIGSTMGTHFFKITPLNKLELVAFIQGKHYGYEIVHRDYHSYKNYLYEVADEGNSTLRIYDLRYLPDSVTIVYDSDSLILKSHNIFIDTSSALLYSCGTTTPNSFEASRVLSLANPEVPELVIDYNYIPSAHDVYVRNDTAYYFTGGVLKVADFSNPTMPLPLGELNYYVDQGYTHSGWTTDDGKTLILCDENPELRFKVCDVSDLTDIKVLAATKPETYVGTFPHNVMIKGRYAYFSYYNDGLQIYDIKDPENPKRVAYYDTYDGDDSGWYRGAWGIYALLPSGRILISDRKNGLFLFKHVIPPAIADSDADGAGIYPNPVADVAYFYYNQPLNYDYTLTIQDARGRVVKVFEGKEDYLLLDLTDLNKGSYYFTFYSKENNKTLNGKFIKL